jgi:hypothetical protein
MCTARKGVKDLSILPQGLSAVFMAGLPAVLLEDLPAVFMDGLSPFVHSYCLKEFRGAEDGNRA